MNVHFSYKNGDHFDFFHINPLKVYCVGGNFKKYTIKLSAWHIVSIVLKLLNKCFTGLNNNRRDYSLWMNQSGLQITGLGFRHRILHPFGEITFWHLN